MGYHPRIESSKIPSLTTIRTRNSELWFVNNPRLEHSILGYTAKFSSRYNVTLYALAIEGNHLHALAVYADQNRAYFQRDLNSCIARAVEKYAPKYTGGKLWARRYSAEFVPEMDDIFNYFFYVALQPIKDGLVDKLSDYPGYNCFYDAISGREKTFKVINFATLNAARRWNPSEPAKNHVEIVKLSYARLPGFEKMSQNEYKTFMLKEYDKRRLELIALRGKPAAGRRRLLKVKPGTKPINTKKSDINSFRPRILCADRARRSLHEAWYFDIYFNFKRASMSFRNGDLTTPFPVGTYRPSLFSKRDFTVNTRQ